MARGKGGKRRVMKALSPADHEPLLLIVMGVTGAGKSTIGRLLADALGCSFVDGDDLHPIGNIQKMAAGVALSDLDRAPWLAAIAAVADDWRSARQGCVFACSALKRAYRDRLSSDDVRFIYLIEKPGDIRERFARRSAHFMPATLIDDQFDALEAPEPDENVLVSHPASTPAERCLRILEGLAALNLRLNHAHET
jgi:gluconokinase